MAPSPEKASFPNLLLSPVTQAADSMLDGRLPFPVSRNFVMTSFGQVGKQSGAFALVIGIPAIRITSISG
jgi:hypothetical protein